MLANHSEWSQSGDRWLVTRFTEINRSQLERAGCSVGSLGTPGIGEMVDSTKTTGTPFQGSTTACPTCRLPLAWHRLKDLTSCSIADWRIRKGMQSFYRVKVNSSLLSIVEILERSSTI